MTALANTNNYLVKVAKHLRLKTKIVHDLTTEDDDDRAEPSNPKSSSSIESVSGEPPRDKVITLPPSVRHWSNVRRDNVCSVFVAQTKIKGKEIRCAATGTRITPRRGEWPFVGWEGWQTRVLLWTRSSIVAELSCTDRKFFRPRLCRCDGRRRVWVSCFEVIDVPKRNGPWWM